METQTEWTSRLKSRNFRTRMLSSSLAQTNEQAKRNALLTVKKAEALPFLADLSGK
jgi:hypothetical protein